MIKFKQGWIGTPGGKTRDIIVQSKAPNSLVDTIIGYGAVLLGITYLTVKSFKNGSEAHEEAEYRAMDELELLTKKE